MRMLPVRDLVRVFNVESYLNLTLKRERFIVISHAARNGNGRARVLERTT